MANDDQSFLLYFIIGTYFGPDLKGERPPKSVLQRRAERLLPYTIEQLGVSHLEVAEVELVYYYFPNLFPLLLCLHLQFNNKDDIFENIVFIHNPEIYYVKPKDIEQFKRLTGLEDFLLDRDAARLHTVHDGSLKPMHVEAPISTVPDSCTPMLHCCRSPQMNKNDSGPVGKLDQLSSTVAATRDGFALTGSVAMAKVRPTIGLIDIGECDDSYLFRVSLPGVRRDEREFSCEYTQMFEMQTQNLCPSGQFSISFQLPGPVNPQQFSGNFGTDGILEVIVMKRNDVK
ncbi:hypothetical protein D8674_039475 [Pyrus ussuriensis x Pyrus communis]|uniref:SHSP domain-containing protein n=1 Tax=Pyrus ussuriensis x Pyrus communis TaxID=2448454 RepID=A0A5N5GZ36_9ROSA|nr:hypothetical protein D8674_039475 [Pyrus ussuriensis x Pyrus communis]